MAEPRAPGAFAPSDVVIAALIALIIVGLGGVGAQRSRLTSVDRRALHDGAVLSQVASGLAVELERSVADVNEAAHLASRRGGRPPSGFVFGDPSLVIDDAPALSAVDRTDPDVAAILGRTRDTGVVALSQPVDLEAGHRGPLIVAAAYEPDLDGNRPLTTVTRRSSLLGWVVAPVDLGALVSIDLPPRMVATVSDGAVSSSARGIRAPGRLPTQTVAIAEAQLVIRAGDPSAVPLAPATLVLAVGSLLLAAVAAAGTAELLRRLRVERSESARRRSQIQLIGDIGPLVQQSLELADVLPTVAVQLSDHFGLAGVSLSSFTSSGQSIDLFTFGAPPDRTPSPVLRLPTYVPAGTTLALALERGGRTVAQLRLAAGRDLDESELQSLRAITELITAAVANAALYTSQQEALRRLRDLDALKTGFLGTASHELRTPVTAISGFSTLLIDSWERFDDEQRKHFVKRIDANARSLGAVVQDLLDFSLLDRGSIPLALTEIDLGEVVHVVVERLSPVFGDHEIVYTAVPAPTISAEVNGLERVVSNLLTNAIKFSPPNTTVTISVSPSAVDGYAAQVVVSDEGPGIPPEERTQVFTRFFRGTGEVVLRTRGVGIGLSVVAELVALLHGSVEVDDAPGGGARFTLRFPSATSPTDLEEDAHAPAH